MESVSPVLTEEFVEIEKVIALDQKQYIPLIVLPVLYQDGVVGMCVRFRLTDEERKAITDGADFVISEMTFGQSFTPLCVVVCKPDTNPFV
jgi:hypothetical protein